MADLGMGATGAPAPSAIFLKVVVAYTRHSTSLSLNTFREASKVLLGYSFRGLRPQAPSL